MSASTSSPKKAAPGDPSSVASPSSLDFLARESAELVIAFSGAAGSGVRDVVAQTDTILGELGYETVKIKLSEIIQRTGLQQGLLSSEEKGRLHDRTVRYQILQDVGNRLREKFATDILAELSIATIAVHRTNSAGDEKAVTEIVPKRVAYLIDQLKHPEEVALLRRVYGQLFYLVGVLASEGQRLKNLADEGVGGSSATKVIQRDRKEKADHGQQLDSTLKHADLFVRNNNPNRASVTRNLRRFLELLHGQNGLTPTVHEYAMYAAYSASLRSACLSRQVGAAITDAAGQLLATGCNDVPRAGGGLYSPSDGDGDQRCVFRGARCHNDHHKNELATEIQDILLGFGIAAEQTSGIVAKIRSDTRLRDLIEFSRSVHAEMDAIVSVARAGNGSVRAGRLYTTTFPCHNCARHVIAAGISEVYYVEPYEKSLALQLHDDAIVGDPEEGVAPTGKVMFVHFEGVAPRQYQNLFLPRSERKEKGGLARVVIPRTSNKTAFEYLDSYIDLESKVIQTLSSKGLVAAA